MRGRDFYDGIFDRLDWHTYASTQTEIRTSKWSRDRCFRDWQSLLQRRRNRFTRQVHICSKTTAWICLPRIILQEIGFSWSKEVWQGAQWVTNWIRLAVGFALQCSYFSVCCRNVPCTQLVVERHLGMGRCTESFLNGASNGIGGEDVRLYWFHKRNVLPNGAWKWVGLKIYITIITKNVCLAVRTVNCIKVRASPSNLYPK